MNGSTPQPDLSLNADQEGLLRTALSSNAKPTSRSSLGAVRNGSLSSSQQYSVAPSDVYTTSPNGEHDILADLDSSELFDPAEFEDETYDWDANDETSYGDLNGGDLLNEEDMHDKRKASVGPDDEDTTSSKRQENQGRTPKKPGRKPIMAEPTTKRKAQNRAAQRAFRERKERHLKDLEVKVDDLEKASEATNHENGRLRAQVEKLNTELTEYRKRLSISNTATGYSPPASAGRNRALYIPNENDFAFAFPKFGDLPGASFLKNGSLATSSEPPKALQRPSSVVKPSPAKQNTDSPSPVTSIAPALTSTLTQSPELTHMGSNSGSKSGESSITDLTSMFSPSMLASTSRTHSGDYISFPGGMATANTVRNGNTNNGVFGNVPSAKFSRAHSASMTNSPASSMSHALDSSTGTTPEPSAGSPENGRTGEGSLDSISEEATVKSQLGGSLEPLNSSNTGIYGIDSMAQQNNGQFDPVLFGDYRDPQDSILNAYDEFFNDAFPDQDFTSPFNTGDNLALEPKRDLIKEIEIQENSDEPPATKQYGPENFIGCDKLWDRVRASTAYQSGEVDMDDLCAQLKSKAKCSGSGAVIDKAHVDRILGPVQTEETRDGLP